MPRTSLMVLVLLLGALGAQSPAIAPSAAVTAASAPDGRDMPGQAPETLRGRPALEDKGPGIGRSGSSDRALPGRPGFQPNPQPNPGRPAFTPTPSKPAPSPPQRPSTKSASMPPPMVFFIARGEPDACGPGCSEWIGADGAIDVGAAARLRTLLNRLGQRRLPVFFHSPGGSVEGSLAIGRLMRARGLTASVARTIPQGCDPKQSREEACDRIKRGGQDLTAELDTGSTMCFSACVYAIVGATVREIGPGAKLGIHSSSFTFGNSEASARPPGRVMRATIEASYERLGRYFVEMGIDPSLVTAAREISNDHIRVLSRSEIRSFKIDGRGFVEDGWRLSTPPARAIHKSFVVERAGSGDFRDAVVNLSCGAGDRLRVDVALEHATSDTAAENGLRLTAGGAVRALSPRRHLTLNRSKTEYEISTADLSPAFFMDAGASITVSAVPPTEAFARNANKVAERSGEFSVTLSTVGLAPVLAKLLPQCGISASAIKAQAVPRLAP